MTAFIGKILFRVWKTTIYHPTSIYGQYFASCDKTFSVYLSNYHQFDDISQTTTFLTNRFFFLYSKIVSAIEKHHNINRLCAPRTGATSIKYCHFLVYLIRRKSLSINFLFVNNSKIFNSNYYLINNYLFDWSFGRFSNYSSKAILFFDVIRQFYYTYND
jgi:hypothetical protein